MRPESARPFFFALTLAALGAFHQEVAAETTASVTASRSTSTASAGERPSALCQQADALRKQGKRREAIRLYQEAVTLDYSLMKCRYHLGVLLFQEGKTEEALEHLKQSAGQADKPAEGFNWLAKARAKIGDESGAIEVWQHALQIDPKFVEAHYNMAMVFRKQGQISKARKELQAALKKKPNYKPAKQALAKLPKK